MSLEFHRFKIMSQKKNTIEEHEILKNAYRPINKINNKNNYRVVVRSGEVQVILIEEEENK